MASRLYFNKKIGILMLAWLTKPLSPKQIWWIIAVFVGTTAGLGGYAFWLCPAFPVREAHSFVIPNFPGRLSLVQISDLHYRPSGALWPRVTRLVNEAQADFIVITGDLTETAALLPDALEWLKTLRCHERIYFCPGNWDHWSNNLKSGLRERLQEIGIRLLDNEGETIDWQGGQFFLAGIDDAFYGQAKPQQALQDRATGLATIVISHAPCVVYRLESAAVGLVLSGHTHGGQVRLPWWGALMTPPGSAKFQQGEYQFGAMRLYVNRGIGNSILPVRFLCSPEVTQLWISGKSAELAP
jgi:predicted MPP superfamily phosphohydrolase